MYDWEVTLNQLNLLDSHDTPRLLSIVQNDRASVRLGTILLMTFPGAPSVYYGDEIGLAGHRDPDCRRTIPWNKPETWDQDTLAYYKQLIALRKNHIALRRGRYHRLYAEGLTFAFGRIHESDRALIVTNAGEAADTVEIPVNNLFGDGVVVEAEYGSASAIVESGKVKLTVPARDGLMLFAKP
jgi:glycosidase